MGDDAVAPPPAVELPVAPEPAEPPAEPPAEDATESNEVPHRSRGWGVPGVGWRGWGVQDGPGVGNRWEVH